MKTLSRSASRRPAVWLASMALVASVAACGGGDDNTPEAGAGSGAPTAPTTPTTPTTPNVTALSGTASLDSPIIGGNVEVRCEGSTTVLNAVTSATGAWQIDTTGQTLPCAVKVSGGNLPAGQAYHSLAWAYDNVNISPLTDLMVANAVSRLPALWWGGSGPSGLSALSQSSLDDALAALRAALGLAALDGVNPITVPTQEQVLSVLRAMQLALSQTGIDYAGLVSAAASGGFTFPESFRIAVSNNYGAGGGAVVPGPGGNYTLTLNVSAMGTSTAITIENMPKPANQAEFCGWVNDQSSPLSLSQYSSGGGAGTLTINSCSFNGSVGQVSATVNITAPYALTVPYSVTYTYN